MQRHAIAFGRKVARVSQDEYPHGGLQNPDVDNEEPRVGPLELFFDLVFVFALTQVTALLAEELTWVNMVRGLAILTVVWWAWAGFSWLTNLVRADDGWARLVMFAAMGAMLIVSLAVPDAFAGSGETFGFAYLVLSILYIVLYAVLTRSDPQLFRSVLKLAVGFLSAPLLLVVAGFLDAGIARGGLWGGAILLLIVGAFGSGTEWRVHPAHFAERHGLIIIIALGESIVAIGIGASEFALDANAIVGSLLGLVIAACLWWLYFDIVALVAERRLSAATGVAQVRMARDSYTILHLPMVAGIVFFALGVKKVLLKPEAPMYLVAETALLGGIALYLLAHVLFRYRNTKSWNVQRVVVAVGFMVAIPLAREIDGLVVLALAAGVLVALTTFETVKFREARHAVRHHGQGATWTQRADEPAS
jgi:low temperature requirement protein LtrA